MKVVTFGGGTGHYTLLRALRLIEDVHITAVVSVADNGGSSGVLRDSMGVLPPGDILKAILALSELDPEFVYDFLLHRFEEGTYEGHTIGNVLLAKHAERTRDFMSAINSLRQMLCVRHVVLPVSLDQVDIEAHFRDGSVLVGEKNIDAYAGIEPPVGICLIPPHVRLYPPVAQAVDAADMIVVAPGSLHTSLLPVLSVRGVGHAIARHQVPLVFVCNSMSHMGDTHGLCPHKMAEILEHTLGRSFTSIIVNNAPLAPDTARRYEEERSFPFICTPHCPRVHSMINRPLLLDGALARHDYALLKDALIEVDSTTLTK